MGNNPPFSYRLEGREGIERAAFAGRVVASAAGMKSIVEEEGRADIMITHELRKPHLFLSFPCVCPEPVLVT